MDVEELIKENGIEIKEITNDSYGHGFFNVLCSDLKKRRKDCIPIITIYRYLPRDKRICILSHEFGHFVHYYRTKLSWPEYIKRHYSSKRDKIKVEKFCWDYAEKTFRYNDLYYCFNELKEKSLKGYL